MTGSTHSCAHNYMYNMYFSLYIYIYIYIYICICVRILWNGIDQFSYDNLFKKFDLELIFKSEEGQYNIMVAAQIEILLQKNPKGFYTSDDIVKGVAKVQVFRDIALQDIHVKLEGKAVVGVDYGGGRGIRSRRARRGAFLEAQLAPELSRDRHQRAVETHSLFKLRNTVFPPKEIRDVSSSNFSLIPGEYEYEFEFKFPKLIKPTLEMRLMGKNLSNSKGGFLFSTENLPPSMGEGAIERTGVRITYSVGATINRDSVIKSNIHEDVQLRFLPCQPLAASGGISLSSDPVSLQIFPKAIDFGDGASKSSSQAKEERSGGFFTRLRRYLEDTSTNDQNHRNSSEVRCSLRLRSPTFNETINEKLNLRLYLSLDKITGIVEKQLDDLGVLYLRSLTITLRHTTTLEAKSHVKKLTGSLDLISKKFENVKIDLTDHSLVNGSNSNHHEIPIPDDVYLETLIPLNTVPTFTYPTVRRDYVIEVNASFSSSITESGASHKKKLSLITPIVILSGAYDHPPEFTSSEDPTSRDQLPSYNESIN